MANNMKRIVLTMDANRMPLPMLMQVLGLMSHLEEMAEEIGGNLITISEQMDQSEAIHRLPKVRAEVLPIREPERPEPPAATVMELTEGPAAILAELRNANGALRRSEIAERFPDKKGNVVGTWLHVLERRGLVSSEAGEDCPVYTATMQPEMA
jgi:hypothetical protein